MEGSYYGTVTIFTLVVLRAMTRQCHNPSSVSICMQSLVFIDSDASETNLDVQQTLSFRPHQNRINSELGPLDKSP